jgi:translation initiation factor IF-3
LSRAGFGVVRPICAKGVVLFKKCRRRFVFFGRNLIIIKEVEINEKIRDGQIRVVDENGAQLGIMSAYEANLIADRKNLDLVKISPMATPPVCKIMDYGKYKFDTAKREKDARKNQKGSELKEVWLSMTIDKHDLETKAKSAQKFLTAGDKVKVSIRMRGRQQTHADIGVEVMNRFFAILEDVCVIDKKPVTEGRNILMILNPKK